MRIATPASNLLDRSIYRLRMLCNSIGWVRLDIFLSHTIGNFQFVHMQWVQMYRPDNPNTWHFPFEVDVCLASREGNTAFLCRVDVDHGRMTRT